MAVVKVTKRGGSAATSTTCSKDDRGMDSSQSSMVAIVQPPLGNFTKPS